MHSLLRLFRDADPAGAGGASAPAATPSAPVPDPVGPSVSAIQAKIAAARAAVDGGQSLADHIRGVTPHHSATQPRNEQQQFQSPVTPDATDTTTDNTAGAGELEPSAPGEAPEAGAPAETPGAPADGAVESETRLTLPAFNDSQQPIELEIEDPNALARMRELVGNVELRRYSEARLQEARDAREQVDELRDIAYADPVGLILNELTPESTLHVVRTLLTDPAIWAAIGEEVLGYGDDTTRAQVANAALRERQGLEDKAADVLASRREWRENGRQLDRAVKGLVPKEWTKPQQAAFERDAFKLIETHIRENGLRKLDPKYVPLVIEAALTKHHLDPLAVLAAQRSGGSSARPQPVRTSARVIKAEPSTGAQFVAGEAKRQLAAKVPGASAGAVPATRGAPPAKQTVDQRIAWMKQNRTHATNPA